MKRNTREQGWRQLVTQICAEYSQLAPTEKFWIRQQCEQIATLQQKLDQLFHQAQGQDVCRSCQGDCCTLGHNHLTLANMLGILDAGQPLPQLDFSKTCPLLTPEGCQLPAAYRPYNCISFVCEQVEGRLTPGQKSEFYAIEKELRHFYQLFHKRYAGGNFCGLLIAAEHLQNRPFLQSNPS